jgi:hypothetical protein
MHFELVSYSATAPGAAGVAATAVVGDSLIVKNSRGPAKILAWWADNQTAGFHQLIFPSGHDTTRGIRTRVRASEVDQLLSQGVGVVVQPQETLSMTIAGSAVAGDVESGSFLVAYNDLPGIAQRHIGWNELDARIEKLTTIDMAITGAAAGYTGSAGIATIVDLLNANRDYAVLGCGISLETCTVALLGPDTGNVRIGMPGNDTDNDLPLNFYPMLARAFDMPCIPVINSGNKASTFLSILQDENNITPTVSLYLALLR